MKHLARSGRRWLCFWPWLLVVAAWALALLAAWTHQSYLINHDYLIIESGLPWAAALLLFLVFWQVMTAAMMLPSSLPRLAHFVQTSRPAARPQRMIAAFLAGYAAVWTGFGAVAFLGDTGIHQLVRSWPWLALHPWLIGAVTFALAGAFQCTPFKQRALRACRRSTEYVQDPACTESESAWRSGLRYGQCCLGSCWALMLVMFGIGAGSLVWMGALAGVMVIEKTVPGGRWLSPFVGIAFLLLAGAWALHPTGLLSSLVG